jgi:antitoxin PrlF
MASVTIKGQVTIPKSVRQHLGIVPGSRVDFRLIADGSVVMLSADKKQSAGRFAQLRGHAGPGLNSDAIMALIRGE